MDHYYMVVESHISEIVETESPEQVPTAVARNKYLQGQWIVRKGKANLHWIGYEFHPSGRITGRQVDIIDLGPITAYDRPGLSPLPVTLRGHNPPPKEGVRPPEKPPPPPPHPIWPSPPERPYPPK